MIHCSVSMLIYKIRKVGVGMSPEQVIEEVTNLCKKHNAKEIILFGSRAKGTALERSDIDIAVTGDICSK